MKPKNCPFCNSPKIKVRTVPMYQVVCSGCGMHGPEFAKHAWAVQAWNKIVRDEGRK